MRNSTCEKYKGKEAPYWARYKHTQTVSRGISIKGCRYNNNLIEKLFPGYEIKQINASPGQRGLCERKHKSGSKH